MPAITIPRGLKVCESLSHFVQWVALVNRSFRLTLDTIEDETGIEINLPGIPAINYGGFAPITLAPLALPERQFGAVTIPRTRGYVGNVFPATVGGGAIGGIVAAREIAGRSLPGGKDLVLPGSDPWRDVLRWINHSFDIIHKELADTVDLPIPLTVPMLNPCDDGDINLVDKLIESNFQDLEDAEYNLCPVCATSAMGALLQPIDDTGAPAGSRWGFINDNYTVDASELSLVFVGSARANCPGLVLNSDNSPFQIPCNPGDLLTLTATAHACLFDPLVALGDTVCTANVTATQQLEISPGVFLWAAANDTTLTITRANLEAAPAGLPINVAVAVPAYAGNRNPPTTALVRFDANPPAGTDLTMLKFCDLNLTIT